LFHNNLILRQAISEYYTTGVTICPLLQLIDDRDSCIGIPPDILNLKQLAMNSIQRNQLAMLIAVNKVLEDHRSLVETVPALAKDASEFNTLIDLIHQDMALQEGLAGSQTTMKYKEEDEMIQTTVQLAAAIFAFAHSTGQLDLENKVRVTPSRLRSMSDKKLETTCRNILALARTIVDSLADYGIHNEFLDKLEEAINTFSSYITRPRAQIVTRSQATRELKEHMLKANDLLRHNMDKLLLLFQDTESLFYNTYKAARTIIDLKGHKTKVPQKD